MALLPFINRFYKSREQVCTAPLRLNAKP
jgi:hypothetical protein